MDYFLGGVGALLSLFPPMGSQNQNGEELLPVRAPSLPGGEGLGMLGMFFPPSPFSPGARPLPSPLTPSFLGFLAYLQSLKGALPTFLGPGLHWEIGLGTFVCLSGTFDAPPPVWCQSPVEISRRAGEAGVFICLKENLPSPVAGARAYLEYIPFC